MRFTLRSSAIAIGVSLTVSLWSVGEPHAQQPPQQQPLVVDTAIQVQTSGPVNEAFAQPIQNQTEPGPLIDKQPPPPVPEEVPQERPDGANAQWIDGYWAWDSTANDFLWVTGTFRNMPPGMRYVAGYWQQTPDGWRWVPGFYAPAQQEQLPFVPEPPASQETGPVGPPPSDNSVYIPGNWNYNQGNFVWRAGFYTAARPGLVWCPPRYQWTPGGILNIAGYWDLPLEDRGLLFAPVVFEQPLWNTPGWRYRPHYVVGTGALLNALFVRPGWSHYYFGNYYGPAYARAGYQPWYTYGANHHDPLYTHARWQNRGNPQWATSLKQTYQDRVAGRAAVPPRTLTQQTALLKNGGNSAARVVSPLNQLANQNVRLQKQTATQLANQQATAQNQRNLTQARQQQELLAAKAFKSGTAQQPAARSLRLTTTAPQAQSGGTTLPKVNGNHVGNLSGTGKQQGTQVVPKVQNFNLPKTQVQQQPNVQNLPRTQIQQQPKVQNYSLPKTQVNQQQQVQNIVQPRTQVQQPPKVQFNNNSTPKAVVNPVKQSVPQYQPKANVSNAKPFVASTSRYTPTANQAPVTRSAPTQRAAVQHAPSAQRAAPVHRGGGNPGNGRKK